MTMAIDISEFRVDLAKRSFETYAQQRREQGDTPEFATYDEQPEHLKASSLAAVDDILSKVEYLGYTVLPKEKATNVVECLTKEQIEGLAEQEHVRWMNEKTAAGYVYGPVKDNDRRVHPCLVPYEDLPETEKDKDRRQVRNVIPLLASIGYAVCDLR